MKKLIIAAVFLAGFAGAGMAQAPEKTKTKTAIARTNSPSMKTTGMQTGEIKTSTPTTSKVVTGKEKREARKAKVNATKTKEKGKPIGGKKRHKARKKAKKAE